MHLSSSRRPRRSLSQAGLIGGMIALIASHFGCATNRISDLDAYPQVAMNRVVPFPDAEDLRHRAFEVIVVDRPAAGIDESLLPSARARARREIEGIAALAGATVIDRSLQDLSAIRTEGVLSEMDGDDSQVSGADYALATRFSKYRFQSTWKRPFKFWTQSEADIANKPGTCTHEASVELDVQMIEIGSNDRLAKTFGLEHSVEQKNKDIDQTCPIQSVTQSVLFEKALDEALSCLRLPLGKMLSPRGHVTEHRKAPESERHIFRISLGSAQGMVAGRDVEIRREQRSVSRSGIETRTERVIAQGVVSDQVMAQVSWVLVDLSKATDEILEGDVVRPVLGEGLLSSLSGPSCKKILDER